MVALAPRYLLAEMVRFHLMTGIVRHRMKAN